MSAGTIVFAKLSLRRAGTWPVPFGRPFAMAGWVSGAFSLRGCPLACGALPPCCAGLGAAGFVASAFAMALAPVDRLAAAAAGADLAAVGEDLDAGARGLVAPRADDEHVGEGQRAFPFDDADGVAATDVNALHQMTSGAREMILVNCRSRSSRATGPKMRVPTGFSSALYSTTPLRSKRM